VQDEYEIRGGGRGREEGLGNAMITPRTTRRGGRGRGVGGGAWYPPSVGEKKKGYTPIKKKNQEKEKTHIVEFAKRTKKTSQN